jgi:hypothetical protein
MGLAIIVHKPTAHQRLDLKDWLQLIDADPALRLVSEPHSSTKGSGQIVSIPTLPGQAELKVGRIYVPFLGFRSGELTMKYQDAMKQPTDPVRLKIAEVARRLGAVIGHDAGDDLLEW